MILPKEIKTQHKIRDAKIVSLYAKAKTMQEIAKEIGLSDSRIERIIFKNKDLLSIDRKYEKFKRYNYLQRQLVDEKGIEKQSQKDSLEIVEAMRKECEGENVISISSFLVIEKPKDSEPNRLDAFLSNQ